MGTRSQSVTSISVSGDILDKQWGKLRGQQVDSGDCAGRLDAMAAGGIRAMSGSAGWHDTGPGCVDAPSRSAVRDLGRPRGGDAIPGAGSFTPQAASPGGLPCRCDFPPNSCRLLPAPGLGEQNLRSPKPRPPDPWPHLLGAGRDLIPPIK